MNRNSPFKKTMKEGVVMEPVEVSWCRECCVGDEGECGQMGHDRVALVEASVVAEAVAADREHIIETLEPSKPGPGTDYETTEWIVAVVRNEL